MDNSGKDPCRVVICGAAGRDYHTFNRIYRNDSDFQVVAFTAAQIPGIDARRYPTSLAGPGYPEGIPICNEDQLESLIEAHQVDRVVFAYSDVSHEHVMRLACRVMAAGADWVIHGPAASMIRARCPVIAVSAVRTGCGKSQVARYLSRALRRQKFKVAVLRHPMPYGDLSSQAVQRFASLADIEAADCTLEEREEYEPHVSVGNLVFAGVDYQAIVDAAQQEADLLIWDGGNNDFPFLIPDLHIVVADALRPDQLLGSFPGEGVLQMADVVIVNKVDAAAEGAVAGMQRTLEDLTPGVPIILADSPVRLDAPIPAGSKVLVVDDGPTLTHGGMPFGAGFKSLEGLDVQVIDPRWSATPEILSVYRQYPHLGSVLPAVGYTPEQREALRRTIDASDADVVVAGTPIDFAGEIPIAKPVVRARYDYQDHGAGILDYVQAFTNQMNTRSEYATR